MAPTEILAANMSTTTWTTVTHTMTAIWTTHEWWLGAPSLPSYAGNSNPQSVGYLWIKDFTVTASPGLLWTTNGLTVSGHLAASTKSFDVPLDRSLQVEGEREVRMRHWCTEGDAIGGNLLYKRQITATKAGVYQLRMPRWFRFLATNVMVFCSGVRNLGTAWGEQDEHDGDLINVTTSRGGLFNVLITADRNDHCARNCCPQSVEYQGSEIVRPRPIDPKRFPKGNDAPKDTPGDVPQQG